MPAKKSLYLLKWVSFFLFCCSFIINANAAKLPPDIEHIVKSGTLVVAIIGIEAPPFSQPQDDGTMTGFDIVLARDIANKLGVQLKINNQAKTFDELITLIENGQADIATNITPTPSRALMVDFTKPYITLKPAILVNRTDVSESGDRRTQYPELNLPTKRIGTLGGSVYVEMAKNDFPSAQIILYTNADQAMADVWQHKLDAVFLDYPHINIWLTKNPDANLYTRLITVESQSIPITLAVSWQKPHLLNWLNTYLISINNYGKQSRWISQHFDMQGIKS